jgi:hypothetical protein
MAEATAERVRLGGDLLIALSNAVARNEKAERRFRYAVTNKLCRIEALLQQVHVSHLVQDQHIKDYIGEKLEADAKASEEFVSQTAYDAGLTMVKYIYELEEAGDAPLRERRKWSNWEI